MRHTPFISAVVFALVLTLGAATASARRVERTPDEQREVLISLLAATDVKLERAALDTVGNDVPHQLILIADLPRVALVVRTRALAALAFYPAPTTKSYLVSLLHERALIGTRAGVPLRRQAIRSLGLGFGAEAVDDLVPLQNERDPLVRASVASALGDTGAPHALPTLEAWLSREPDLTVRTAIDSAISLLRGR